MDIGPEIISDDWPKSWSPMRQRANVNEHELALAARRRRPANPQHSTRRSVAKRPEQNVCPRRTHKRLLTCTLE